MWNTIGKCDIMDMCEKCKKSGMGVCRQHRNGLKKARAQHRIYTPLNDYDYGFLGCSARAWVNQATRSI